MAHRIVLRFSQLFPFIALFIAACGGGSPVPPVPGLKPIDPSGNWTMLATDGGGKTVQFAALFSQTGSVVTSNSFTAAGDPAPFACVPFSASVANGQVVNVSNFTGDVVMGNNFGTFSFNTTLDQAGKSASGTFSNMPPCAGVLQTGTFAAAEVPTATGSWTGTLTPCSYDQQTGICTTIPGAPVGTITTSLNQDDATGNVTGSYQTSGLAAFSSGTAAVNPADQDILSGLVWQFTMTDNGGNKVIVNGLLDMHGAFSGNAFVTNSTTFSLAMSH